MKLHQLFEGKKDRKICVVYGGRFQPFHKGHYAAYKWLCKKFGKENVWLATSDKTNFKKSDKDVSPFSYQDKVEIIVGLYGIPPNRIVKCKNPAFKPSEVFKMYNGYDIIYVAAVGEKDEGRYAASDFFIPIADDFKMRDLKSLDEGKGYYVVVPMQSRGISGTEARDALDGTDNEAAFKKFFGKYDSTVDQLVIARLKELK